MTIELDTQTKFRIKLGHVVDMSRIINAAALTTEAEHGEGAERGGMPIARLWEIAHEMKEEGYLMKEKGYLAEEKDSLSLDPELFHETLRLLVESGYYGAYIGAARGPIKKRRPYPLGNHDARQALNGALDRSHPWHIVSRGGRGMSTSCFPVQCPKEAVMAAFKGIRTENLIEAAVHEHVQTTFGLSQSETIFRAFRNLARTYNDLREVQRKKNTSSTFSRSSVLKLLAGLRGSLQKDNSLDPDSAQQLARAFIEIALCVGIVWRDRERYGHLTLATPCDYQWLLSTLFGLQTSMGGLNRVFFGGILLPGSSRIRDDRGREQGPISSLTAMVQGESGSGKTTFACHLGFDVVRQGGVCLYLALEQWPSDLQRAFYGFGWLPDDDTFDYLGPSSIASQTEEGRSDGFEEDSDSAYEARYFRKFREQVERNHSEGKGILGLMPIRPRSWPQLRQWVDSFLEIDALRDYPTAILMLDPFNAFIALADPPEESEGKFFGNAPSSTGLTHRIRGAVSEIFEMAKASSINILMVCEGEYMRDKEISHITNSSDLVFTLHRIGSGPQEHDVTEAGFHAWSRQLSIRKSRFQKTLSGHHRFEITENGVSIDLAPQAFVEWLEGNIPLRRLDLPLSSGFPDLDYILRGESKREGELFRDSFTVYMGPTGCAKSELATLFLLAPVANTPFLKRTKRKEPGSQHSLLVTFKDDWASVESTLRGPIGDYLGIKDLRKARETLTLLQLPVGFVSAAEILAKLQGIFDQYTYQGESFGRVVFDNLAYMELMSPLLKSDPYFIRSLITLLRQKRVSVLFVTSSMDAVANSTLQARIRDSADNVVVFDRPKSREGEIAVGTTHMAVLKSVHMEHYQGRYRLSFGGERLPREQAEMIESELSKVLEAEDWCSDSEIERIIRIVQSWSIGVRGSISFQPLIRDLLMEICGKENKLKEEIVIRRIMEIHRMQEFLHLKKA
uniref:RecA-superfamily ATPase, KaiC/GvpD/RAD55 family n=1 Tax=Candidatus Kentrum sp. FW TaxID=2126338 RepID=A0A450TXA9_9GAMM|nr:MAG: RecA-superfamily ATPase, KaiC/GvpD/RAD55 family [Candidatus Kentron sp. FW]